MTALQRQFPADLPDPAVALLRALEAEIEGAFRDLPTSELQVLRLRFGVGARRCSWREIARRLRVSVRTARRLERRALHTLRALTLPRDLPHRSLVPRRVLPPRPSGRAAPVRAATAADESAGLVGC